MAIIDQINQGIKEAMRSQDPLRLAVMRMLKSKILAADARCNLSDAEVVKLFKTYYGNLQEAYEQAVAVGRADISDPLKLELAIVQEFLPKALSPVETKQIVMQAIAESGAKTKRDLGLVMKAAMKLNNAVDGKMAKDFANELLSE
jgi:uncharacterized protein